MIFIYLAFLLVFFLMEICYFKIAKHFDIVDKPNARSSHTKITLRGGAIILPVATIIWFFYSGFQYPYFVSGLFTISIVSFLDDLKNLSNKLRILVHAFSVSLMFFELSPSVYWYWYPILFVIIIGVINAYNFMDGINGITGSYSLITLITLLCINEYMVHFTISSYIIFLILAVIVFNFFNFRKIAVCFAGDVGSISMAFILCFLLGQLITASNNFIYLFLLLVYGLDAVSTILFRIILD